LNAWTNLYHTWYVYHGTWAHLNGIIHKPFPSICVCVCVCVCVCIPLSLLGNGSETCLPSCCLATNTQNNKTVERVIFYAVWVVSKESLCIPPVAREQLSKHEELLEASFYMLSMSYQRKVWYLFFPEHLVPA
jgi:hypothetical protein